VRSATKKQLSFPKSKYAKLRKTQSVQLHDVIAEQVGMLTRKKVKKASDHSGGKHIAMPDYVPLLATGPPYSSGDPYPEKTTSSSKRLRGVINTEALGNPATGHLSVGVYGGRLTGAGFPDPNKKTPAEYLYPMPERWLLGDAISSAAAVLQYVPIPRLPQFKRRYTLFAEVDFGWDPILPAPSEGISDLLQECLLNVPGDPHTATMSGFVAVTAYFEAVVTLCAGSNILHSNTMTRNILSVGIDGESWDSAKRQYLFRDWAFEGDHTRIIPVPVSIALDPRADLLIVEAKAHLYGLRAGITDPAGGRWARGTTLR